MAAIRITIEGVARAGSDSGIPIRNLIVLEGRGSCQRLPHIRKSCADGILAMTPFPILGYIKAHAVLFQYTLFDIRPSAILKLLPLCARTAASTTFIVSMIRSSSYAGPTICTPSGRFAMAVGL